MKKILIIIACLAGWWQLQAQSNITGAEYFIDTDPGFGKGTPITITTPAVNVANQSFSFSLATLSTGIHNLFIRTRNAAGKWSITNKFIFYKPSVDATTSSNIVKAEYFFDTDPGFGNGINIPVTAGLNLSNISFSPVISGLSVGMHNLFIRTKNANGSWSVTNRHPVFKPDPANSLPATNITQMEYFIDTDPGFGNGVPIALVPAVNFSDWAIPVNISGLAAGNHHLYVRSKTSRGWSITNEYEFPIASTAATPYINVNAITKKVMCSKDSVSLSFDARGTYNPGNVFNVQLSDSSGSFASPVVIGSVTSTKSAIVNCKLPDNVVGGIHFRVRVVSTSPVVTGIANADALTIGNRAPAKTITGATNVNGIMNYPYSLTAVTGSTWYWMISGGVQQSGTNTNSITVTFTKPATPSTSGTIKLLETNYGCVSDTSRLNLTIYKLRTGITVPAYGCRSFGITINGNSDGSFAAGNTMTAQLSDASGTFSSPVSIGSTAFTGAGLNQAFTINATIPPNTVNSNNYRIRILSSTGTFIGDTSGNISIQKPDIGADISRSKCAGKGYDLRTDFTNAGLTYAYYTNAYVQLTRPDSVDAGEYLVIGTNAGGCMDTAKVTVTSNPKPDIGSDVAVYHTCPGQTTNLLPLFNTTGLTSNWNTVNTSAAPPGVYRLIVNNSYGCTDTAFANIVLEVATWNGTVSNDWHTPANWSTNKVPSSVTHVIISGITPNNCTVSAGDAEVASIQVKSGANFHVGIGRKLLIYQKCATLP